MTTLTRTEVSAPTKKDRCDERDCGAQARFVATFSSGVLMFCLHHGNAKEPSLIAKGAEIARFPY